MNNSFEGTMLSSLFVLKSFDKRYPSLDELEKLKTNFKKDRTMAFLFEEEGILSSEAVHVINFVKVKTQNPDIFINISEKWKKLAKVYLMPISHVPDEEEMRELVLGDYIGKYISLRSKIGD